MTVSRIRKRKSRRKSRRNKRGGELDGQFIRCYDENLAKIEAAILTMSGKHSIDKELARQFIALQTSKIRQDAAQDLIDNTVYITLKEIDEIMAQLVDRFYADPAIKEFYEKDGDHTVYLYTGNSNKSNYFLGVLAYKYMRKDAGPIKFVKSMNDELYDIVGTNPILIIDDVSYSGSQLSDMLNAIFYRRVIVSKQTTPSIYVLLTALNEVSKSRLSRVPQLFTDGYYDKYTVSPFKLIYLEDRLYKPLLYILGIEKYINMLTFFSPMTSHTFTPIVSIYLDHKMADPLSTFTQSLMYGPIIPNGIFNEEIMLVEDQFMPPGAFDMVYDSQEVSKLISKFNTENGTTFKTLGSVPTTKDIVRFIHEKLIESDSKPTRGQTNLGFVPFLNTCNTVILENIHDTEIIKSDYFLFMLPEGCLEGGKECSMPVPGYVEVFYGDMDPVVRSEMIRIHKKINRYRCPKSWYKDGQYQMTCE
jgi:hypothetical protein